MLTKNLASSDLIKQRQARTIYLNYISQQQAANQGCAQRVQIQTGSGVDNASSQLIALAEGAIFTTVAQQEEQLSNTACPVISSAPAPAPAPKSGDNILGFARTLSSTYSGQTIAPTSGDTLTINSQSLGSYDYAVAGTTTITSFTSTDWFTTTEDTRSAWIIVNGDLTINAGQTFTPSVRKLFTVLYVTGNLVCNGTISMTARGANHSGTGNSGGATTAAAIRIGTGTFSAVVNPQVPAAGGAGGARISVNGKNDGISGTAGGTGGGGSGQRFSSGTAGAGAAGTSFSGGSAGGGSVGGAGSDAVTNGGAGGNGTGAVSAGGAGNPGGTGTDPGGNGPNGNNGTGGTLIVIVGGTLSGSGSITANGVNGAQASGQVAGGASGGGSVTVLFGTDSSSITPAASGGVGGQAGSGGAGTARKLAIGAN